jgi:DNA-binding NarL/FixJ family response regulator
MSDTEPIRILIADDHAILRDGLRTLLEREPGFTVVGEAADGEQATRLARELVPDILLLDLAMPRCPGLEVLQQLVPAALPVRTILLAAEIERGEIVKALQLGARGYVLKECATALVFDSIRAVKAGQYWMGTAAQTGLVETLRALMFTPEREESRELGLTRREADIVEGVAAGCTNRQIATKYALSEDTVKHHLTRIFNKLGVSNRLELAVFARRRSLS